MPHRNSYFIMSAIFLVFLIASLAISEDLPRGLGIIYAIDCAFISIVFCLAGVFEGYY